MKNKMNRLTVAILLIFGMVIAGCDETNDPSISQVSITMKAVTSASSINPTGRTANSGIEYTEVLVGVTELELEGEDENDSDSYEDAEEYEIEFEGNFIVDLLNGTSTPDFGFSDLAPGLYEELEIEMEPILPDGNTISISFNYTPEGSSETVVVKYTTDEELEFEIEDDNGFEIESVNINSILLILDLDRLFEGIDFSSAQITDGIIIINENSNSDLADRIKDNLDNALDAGEDDDNDGDFDDDEDDDDDEDND